MILTNFITFRKSFNKSGFRLYPLNTRRVDKLIFKQIVREIGIDTYSLLYFKWITNKDLLYIAQRCSILCNNLNGKRI